jgi:hypothetical protein
LIALRFDFVHKADLLRSKVLTLHIQVYRNELVRVYVDYHIDRSKSVIYNSTKLITYYLFTKFCGILFYTMAAY